MKAQGRLLRFILWLHGPLCCLYPALLLGLPGLPPEPPPLQLQALAPGPPHFSGYSRVPDGKPLVQEAYCGCAVVPSSGQMLGSYLGTQISSAECMLCMNQAPARDWLTVILALELREEMVVCGMVKGGYCREKSHLSVPLLREGPAGQISDVPGTQADTPQCPLLHHWEGCVLLLSPAEAPGFAPSSWRNQ